MSGERGTALLGTLAIGFLVVVLVGQSLVTIGRLSAAAAEAQETARYAATWAARHGDASDAAQVASKLAPEAAIEATATSDGIAVVVTIEVSLVGPEGSPLRSTVTGRAEVPISDYRSAP